MLLFLLSIAVLSIGGIASLMTGFSNRLSSIIGAVSAVIGCVMGLFAAADAFGREEAPYFHTAWNVPWGSFSVEIDPLSAFFLLPLFILSGLAAIYGYEYMMPYGKHKKLGPSWFFFNFLIASMALTVTARNGVLFLAVWEAMAISSFFLVTFESGNPKTSFAGLYYIIAAHLGMAALLVMFIILGSHAGSLEFSDFAEIEGMTPAVAGTIFILAVAGFGSKAGFIPFHVWLPEAHPAAPSHVSAVMSGVMIKMGIYGLLRILTFLRPVETWWGVTMLAIGLLSGIMGVMFAMSQNNLKRLLAFSSVENMGIIAIGIGLGLLGISRQFVPLEVLGFGGALLHVINHAAFKGLLFMAAGAALHETGTVELSRLGGLLKKMPFTGALFALGSVAICGIPPLNGFISEFLIYIGAFFSIIQRPAGALHGADIATIMGLALIGGLAALCFTRAFGIVFLGEPRTSAPEHAHDPGFAMKFSMGALALICVALGFGGAFIIPALAKPLGVIIGTDVSTETVLRYGVDNYTGVFIGSVALVAVIALFALLRHKLLYKRVIRQGVTWDCGYAAPTARMQYTGSSFSQFAVDFFALILHPVKRLTHIQEYFPKRASFSLELSDVFENLLYWPLFDKGEWLSAKLQWLKVARANVYILYISLALVALLIWGFGFTK